MITRIQATGEFHGKQLQAPCDLRFGQRQQPKWFDPFSVQLPCLDPCNPCYSYFLLRLPALFQDPSRVLRFAGSSLSLLAGSRAKAHSFTMTRLAALPERSVIEVGGEDRTNFLQGLVSNDVTHAIPGRSVWAALLTPQGKWLADFFILADGDRLLLDCERAQVPSLVQRLSRFRLRSRVTLRAAEELSVYAAWDGIPTAGPTAGPAIVATDPRVPEAGWRLLAATPLPATAFEADWDRHRLALGLPDGSRDLEAEKTVLLEAGFDELSGVSWTKGCYMGQELTARTKYRGLVKRRLVPVSVSGALPPPGTPVLRNAVDVGTMRSGRDRSGLAVLRIDALHDTLTCGDATLTPRIPAWMALPEAVGQ
jgi:folate-binding protein YgfZ